ncbi:MAG: peptidoglycan-binding domain-containing protein, partial [Hyphomicrobiaceae bacterium]
GDFEEPWRNVRQLRSGSIAEIQRHLQAGGYAISKIDGKIGANTRSQIGRYQIAAGLNVDCWPSKALLAQMRK